MLERMAPVLAPDYLVRDGVLVSVVEHGVLKRIFTALNADSLDLLTVGDEREIGVSASCDKRARGLYVSDSVLAVSHDRVNASVREVLEYCKVRERMIESAAKAADDDDVVSTSLERRLDRKLSVGKVLFGRHLDKLGSALYF